MIVTLILFFFLGVAVGSFLNVVADRLPAGKSLISPPSHCPSCKTKIARKDLIPVVSYLWLKGQCRYCKARIPLRSFIVEVITGLLFAFLYWHFGLNYELFLLLAYTAFFVVLFITDMELQILPNKIVYPGIVFAILIASIGTLFGFEPSFMSNLSIISKMWIVNAAIGGVVGFIILLIIAVISELIFHRSGMGAGDIKLAGLMGLVTGFPLVLVAIYFAAILGGIIAVALLLFKIKSRKDYIAYGTILVIATLSSLIWGNSFLSWYLLLGRLPTF
jgi:leader peptidase (prepilin peptidase) / N-methyltransferase